MLKDPLYQKIVSGLAGHLDAKIFERCMGDLLRPEFPGLVPVTGGSDAGMDGSIPDPEGGEAYPLVCTTEEDVIGNLTKSLDSWMASGRPSRKAVLATSQALTPQRRRNLADRAREKAFTLLQVVERDGIADRLYRNSRWRRELLGVSGAQAALSAVPLTRRPLLNLEPVGREQDMEWLRASQGDRVLFGEPGSGKTFLPYSMIRNGWDALFLTSDHQGEIADALRDLQPRNVVVDDAHVDPGLLTRLVRLREEIGAEFDLVALSWKGTREAVVEALGGPPESRVRRLELLTRDEILEVIRQVGVEAGDDVLAHLVDQAANKPGLAVTIASLWLRGEWQRVLDGTVLRRTILDHFPKDSAALLASFGLGGKRGVTMAVAGNFLELGRLDLYQKLSTLAEGGIVFQSGTDTFTVSPPQLRSALLREVFFPETGLALPYRPLLEQAPERDSAVEAIVEARAYGAKVPIDELRDLLSEAGSRHAWEVFAALGEEEARWTWEHYPKDWLDVVTPLLDRIPEQIIPSILERAAAGRFDHVMSLLSDWVRDIRVAAPVALQRRWRVARAAKAFLLAEGNPRAAVAAISLALSPDGSSLSLDPGSGRTVILRSGLLPLPQLGEVPQIWEQVKGVLPEIEATIWPHISSILWNWVHPEYAAKSEVSSDVLEVSHAFAKRLLNDLALRVVESPGLVAALNRYAVQIGLELPVKEDPVFSLLYPESYGARQDPARQEALVQLAEMWAAMSSIEVARQVAFYEREARRIGKAGWHEVPALCRMLAEKVEEPEAWLNAFLDEPEIAGPMVSPFLERLAESQRTGWAEQIERGLDTARLAWTATGLVLRMADPPPLLMEKALNKARHMMPDLVLGLCAQRAVPVATLLALLRSPDARTALAAAIGEWEAEPQGNIRMEVRADWRAAVLRAKTEDYSGVQEGIETEFWLGVLVGQDSDLAFDWLRQRLGDADLPGSFLGDSPFALALHALREDQKIQLLKESRVHPILFSVLPTLIGKSPELYRMLLGEVRLSKYHLEPLRGRPNAEWEGLVAVALDAGYTPEQIAAAALRPPHSWVGFGQEYWGEWDESFAVLANRPQEGLREIARHGRQQVQQYIEEAKAEQKKFELHGRRR